MAKKQMISTKLDPATIQRIKQLARAWDCPQSRVIEHCILHAPGSEHYRRAEARAIVSDILDDAKARIVRDTPF